MIRRLASSMAGNSPTSVTSPVQACMSLKVDLITFNFTRRLPYRLKPTLLQAAVGRGVHFEVRSSALLRAHTASLWASRLRKQSAALHSEQKDMQLVLSEIQLQE